MSRLSRAGCSEVWLVERYKRMVGTEQIIHGSVRDK